MYIKLLITMPRFQRQKVGWLSFTLIKKRNINGVAKIIRIMNDIPLTIIILYIRLPDAE